MRSVYFLLSILAILCISSSRANDLVAGTIYNTRLNWQTRANYMAILFMKRVKEVFYADPNQQIIKGIIARDIYRTEASAILTAGGVEFTYANIHLKSARSRGLHYQIEIYV